MGIPSYFTHIVKRHRNIIKKYDKKTLAVNNLYMDCNSIIYETVAELQQSSDFEKQVINEVCNKIIIHIKNIAPSSRVMIAFDGVAPVAKLTQQKTRRYKTVFQNKLLNAHLKKETDDNAWNTSAITPGTQFMYNLGNHIKNRFANPREFNIQELLVSTSAEPGEGEHKIFDYIRNTIEHHFNTTTVIYGLDADLIMLVLNHLHICKEMYLYRETPHFIKSIDETLDPNTNYLMDIPEFAKVLQNELTNTLAPDNKTPDNKTPDNKTPDNKTPDNKTPDNKMFDYILLCFFLGNDFLPHFPALNIRTSGIDRLMNVYKEVLGKNNETLIYGSTSISNTSTSNTSSTSTSSTGKKINWKNMRKLISVLAKNEEEYIKTEYISRDKFRQPIADETEIEKKLLLLPMKHRNTERYINPFNAGWQNRYYSTLFDIDIDDTRRKQICINYLEGFEWTMNYYTTECIDWRWSYNYDYPPLLSDLIKYIPYFDTQLITPKEPKPLRELVQLCYVLPRDNLTLLPEKIRKTLICEHSDWYDTDYKFEWTFCKYFWESHVKTPKINIDELEKIIDEYERV